MYERAHINKIKQKVHTINSFCLFLIFLFFLNQIKYTYKHLLKAHSTGERFLNVLKNVSWRLSNVQIAFTLCQL